MSRDNSKKSTSNHKKEDGTFHSKHIIIIPRQKAPEPYLG